MTLTDAHLEFIKAAASTIEFGSITIKAGTDNNLDIIIENRIRLPKEYAKTDRRPPLLQHGEGLRPGYAPHSPVPAMQAGTLARTRHGR